MSKRTNDTENGESHKQPRLSGAPSSGGEAQGGSTEVEHAVSKQPGATPAQQLLQGLQVLLDAEHKQLVRAQHQETTKLRALQLQEHQQLVRQHQHQVISAEQRQQQLEKLQYRQEFERTRLQQMQKEKQQQLQRKHQQLVLTKQHQLRIATGDRELQLILPRTLQTWLETPAQVPQKQNREVSQRVATSEFRESGGLPRAAEIPKEQARLSHTVEEVRRASQADVARCREQITSLSTTVETMRQDMKRLRDENDALSAQLDDDHNLRAIQMSRILDDVDRISGTTTQADRELDKRVTSAMEAMRGLAEEARDGQAALRTSVTQLSADHNALSTKMAGLEKSVDDINARVNGTAREEDGRGELHQLKVANADLRDVIRTLRANETNRQQEATQVQHIEGTQGEDYHMRAEHTRKEADREAKVTKADDVTNTLVDARLADLDARLTQALNQQQTQIALTQQVIEMYDAAQRRVSELEEQVTQLRQLYEHQQTSSNRP